MRVIKRLATLLPGFLALNSQSANGAYNDGARPSDVEDALRDVVIVPLNQGEPLYLAGHRSHSSHSSHRSSSGSSGHSSHSSHSSHRSSGGGGAAPSRSTAPRYNSDPLGQPPAPTYPKEYQRQPSDKLKLDRITLIRRVQLALNLHGYYHGSIDGLMGPQTRAAIQNYRIDKGLKEWGLIDAELLNSLGILAP
ncbi:peptidoglycan-binding protein [Alcanivorax sediminis]|uniref:peptidoglycan-binding protein n=1 Tax=Alcanivorax sediminis TaxID=2663008 RepID=UPI001AD9063D|nr:peptidoglycan-binding protein [Alcanivorax sediminis]